MEAQYCMVYESSRVFSLFFYDSNGFLELHTAIVYDY